MKKVKRNLTVVCVLTGLCVLLFAGVTVVGIVFQVLPVWISGAILTVVSVWVFAGGIYRERLYDAVEHRMKVNDPAGARTILDRAEHNHLFYPLARIVACQLYIRVALVQDDTVTAEHYVSRLRHGGGAGWKYRTAYVVVLMNLDWEEVGVARHEFEEFRSACAHSQIYRSRIQILETIFDHIDGKAGELPDEAKTSPYPLVHRVIRKYC